MNSGKLFLIPTVLHEDEYALQALPLYLIDAVKQCDIFFVENEKTARRFLKKIWKEIIIDNYEWYTIHKAEEEQKSTFANALKSGKNVGIISEAGCPGIADPGQILVAEAQKINATVVPLAGPNSIVLALMASGMNGQQFKFNGYLPIDDRMRKKAIKELETESEKKNCTQIFIETPYRNNALLKDILACCRNETRLCIAIDITASTEKIQTKTIKEWKNIATDLHKKPAIFLLQY
ncbi:MAG: SAM-dependent methyltransferase [Chitinophagaceae bacterium]|jgi:16S rRNA (cytidine1402-2'-O)-methyltransferase|nr:SAM-dependent methyltransferase [Chitinophagaceae bacterium]